MSNLLAETKEVLMSHGKTVDDVLWVGSTEAYSTWKEFERVANIEYDNGYGGNEIAGNLIVVGKDWWLERGEYDGSEWWNFKTIPIKPITKGVLKSVLNEEYEDRVTFESVTEEENAK